MNNIEEKIKRLEKKINDLTTVVNILTIAAFISVATSLAIVLSN
jgi:archaellum component FlaC